VPPSLDTPAVTGKIENAGNFDRLFAAHYAALTRIVYRVVGDIGLAEELAAEAFWKLHRKPPASDYNLAGWLYRTGLRLALDNLKKRKRREHYESSRTGCGRAAEPGGRPRKNRAADSREANIGCAQALASRVTCVAWRRVYARRNRLNLVRQPEFRRNSSNTRRYGFPKGVCESIWRTLTRRKCANGL
jgi:hypothetical protein